MGSTELETKIQAYQPHLASELRKILSSCGVQGPWAAVALAYHHGNSFVPVIGVLPEPSYEATKKNFDSIVEDIFNPAEWADYDEWAIAKEVEAFGYELEAMVLEIEAANSPGRELMNRVCTGMREHLLADGLLAESGVVYGCEYSMVNFLENVRETNPESAVNYRSCGIASGRV